MDKYIIYRHFESFTRVKRFETKIENDDDDIYVIYHYERVLVNILIKRFQI